MDPRSVFCPNLTCPARGHRGRGNITIHSPQERRFQCTVCGQTFSERTGTMVSRRHLPVAAITLVVTLVAHGCPIAAIVAAVGVQARTVRGWLAAAGAHCEQVHRAVVLRPQDLGQVQADELRVKTQRGVVWVALALAVPTRLWLGGVVSASRDGRLIRALLGLVRACALPRPLLVAVDGLVAYVTATQQAFRTPQPTGRRGRPRLAPWPDLVIGRVIKQYAQRRVVGITRRLAHGRAPLLARLLAQTQGGGVLNTAYIERLNATFRARLAALTRRTRGLARRQAWLHAGMYLVSTVYNFCTYHDSLTVEGRERTPAMAAGLTDQRWRVADLLWQRVPPPRWQPPKRRGRRSKALQQLIAQWVL